MKYSVVYVEWNDSVGASGWRSPKECKAMSKPIKTVGFSIWEDSENIAIAQSYDRENEHIDNYIVIPKGCIIKRIKYE